MKSAGIILLGLAGREVNILRLAMLKSRGYEIWTCNDFWRPFPFLVPERAYQIHKDNIVAVDEFGNTRDRNDFVDQCKSRGVRDIIHDLKFDDYRWYYSHQPESWYRSTINYMFVDAWDRIESGNVEPSIILEGMPFMGKEERAYQRETVISAVRMTIAKGIHCQPVHWDYWMKDHQPGRSPYSLNKHDHGLFESMVKKAIKGESK